MSVEATFSACSARIACVFQVPIIANRSAGRSVAVATDEGALFSYAIPAFKKTAALYPGFRVTTIAEGGNGNLVLGGEDGSMAAVDVKSFEVIWKARVHTGIVSPILVAGDGKTALTASADGTIATVRLSDGAVEGRVSTLPGKAITDIDFLSPTLVVAVHEDGTIAQINLKTGSLFSTFAGHGGWISSVQSLGAGDYVTANVDGTLSFFEVGSQRAVRETKAHGDVAAGAKTFSVAGASHLLSVGFDGAVKLWDAKGQRLEGEMDHGGAVLFFDYVSGS